MRSNSGRPPTGTPDYLSLITRVIRHADRKTTEGDRESEDSDCSRPVQLVRESGRHRKSRQAGSRSGRKGQRRPRQGMGTQVDEWSMGGSPHFLSNINHYLDSLSAHSQPHPTLHHTPNALQELLRRGDEELLKHRQSQQKHRSTHPTPPKDHQLARIAHQNAALRKAVAQQEAKIEQMQQEISSHLDHCRQREKQQRGQIGELVKTLTTALAKMEKQKAKAGRMKQLLRQLGEEARRMQQASSDEESEIGSRLEATMPRQEDSRLLP